MPTVSVTNPGTLTNYDGNPIYDFISATDSDANALTYGASGLPAGLSVNTVTGSISGTVTPGDYTTSPYTVTITATDSVESESDSQPFTWNINEPTVSVNSPGNQTNYDGDSINLSITGTHEGGDVNYSATGLPPGLSMGYYTGIISGTIANAADIGSPYAVTVTATNTIDDVSASQSFNWVVNNPVSSTAPSNQTNYDGDAGISLQFSATDAEGNSLNYSASNLPSGLSIDPSAGTITGTIANTADQSSPNSVTVTATDSVNGASSSQTFTWTVNNPVSVSPPSDQTNYDGDSPSLSISATDAESNALNYSASGLPSGLSIDSSAGTITGTISSSADTSSPYSVTVTATDSVNGASSSQTFNWTVNPVTVSLTSPGDQSNGDGDSVDLPLSASDSAGHALTYSATNLPDGLSIDSDSGVISGTVSSNSDGQGTFSVTLTATDTPADVSATQTINWTVTPVLALAQGDQYNDDGDTVSVGDYFWDTASSDSVTYSATGLPSGLSIDSSSGTISGTIAYGDSASSPYSVTITATDTTAGTSTNVGFAWNISPLSISFIEMGTEANLPGDSVSDAPVCATTSDGSSLTFSASGLPAGLSIDSSTGTISGTVSSGAGSGSPYDVTVTATQPSAGVSVTQSVAWTVASMYLENPGDETNIPGDSVDITLVSADGVGGSPTFSATGLPAGLSIDSGTGEISGTVSSGAVSGSPYSVTVTEADGATSVSQSFNWNVQQIALTSPGGLFNTDGEKVRVPISISAPAGDSISYSASGLPSGLKLNATTGTIYGKIASNADAGGPYSVTVTATDTTASASTSETFNWTVAQAGQIGQNPLPAGQLTLGEWQEIQRIMFAGAARRRENVAYYERQVVTDATNIGATIADIAANGNSPARSAALAGYVSDLLRHLSRLSSEQEKLDLATEAYNAATNAISRIMSGR